MNRLACFVEGHTEVLFLMKLLDAIAGESNVRIEHRTIRGGTSRTRTMGLATAMRPDTGQEYYVLIYDCGGDKLVKSRIIEEHENLTRRGYSKIIGMRDVRPDFTHADIERLEKGLPSYIKTKLIPVEFVLSIMEIEAWFLADVTHFERIDPAITVPAIQARLGFNPESDDLELRGTPANDLDECYAIGGKSYNKQSVRTTIAALDADNIYLNVVSRFNYLSRLVASIESFLS